MLLLALVGSAVGGFLLWKRREVNRAVEISQDPWPSVVAETHTVIPADADTSSDPAPEPLKKPVRKRTKKVPDASSD